MNCKEFTRSYMLDMFHAIAHYDRRLAMPIALERYAQARLNAFESVAGYSQSNRPEALARSVAHTMLKDLGCTGLDLLTWTALLNALASIDRQKGIGFGGANALYQELKKSAQRRADELDSTRDDNFHNNILKVF